MGLDEMMAICAVLALVCTILNLNEYAVGRLKKISEYVFKWGGRAFSLLTVIFTAFLFIQFSLSSEVPSRIDIVILIVYGFLVVFLSIFALLEVHSKQVRARFKLLDEVELARQKAFAQLISTVEQTRH